MEERDQQLLHEILNRLTNVEIQFASVKTRLETIERINTELIKTVNELQLNYHQTKGAIYLANWLAVALITITAGIGGVFLSNQASGIKNNVQQQNFPTQNN